MTINPVTPDQISELYRKRAKNYDFSANLYYLIGFREHHYRIQVVNALGLQPGDTVVEIGCGTGLNFPLLQKAVGPQGKIIGVDLTDAMLAQARERVKENGWTNVELIQTDAGKYEFPQNIDGVISTFAITLAPEFDKIIQNGAKALKSGGRFAILDFKKPEQLPMWLINFGVFITKPFGVSLDLADRHPWESIQKYLKNTTLKEIFLGFVYLSVGENA